jgi:hypothetical protein
MIIVRAARLDRRGVGAVGGAADSGGTHPLGDDFVILGTYLNGPSTGQLSLYGITVSVAGPLARSIPLRAFAGSPVHQGSRRAPAGSRRETTALRRNGDRLARQPGDECTERPRAGTASADESGQVPPPAENAPAPEASSQLMSPFLPDAPAPATAADHSGPAPRGCPALRVTAGRHDADPFPGRHHPWQRQRHCACGAYLTVTRRRETGRRDRKRLRVTLRRPGLQGENPGKKERS